MTTEQTDPKPGEREPLTNDELAVLLERWDETDATLQRQIVGVLINKLAELESANAELRRELALVRDMENEAGKMIGDSFDQVAALESRVALLEGLLRVTRSALVDNGVGIKENERQFKEYCVYCDWPFGRKYPDQNGTPHDHRPDCIINRIDAALAEKGGGA